MGATSKLNTVYLVYFIIHIPILFCMSFHLHSSWDDALDLRWVQI